MAPELSLQALSPDNRGLATSLRGGEGREAAGLVKLGLHFPAVIAVAKQWEVLSPI